METKLLNFDLSQKESGFIPISTKEIPVSLGYVYFSTNIYLCWIFLSNSGNVALTNEMMGEIMAVLSELNTEKGK